MCNFEKRILALETKIHDLDCNIKHYGRCYVEDQDTKDWKIVDLRDVVKTLSDYVRIRVAKNDTALEVIVDE